MYLRAFPLDIILSIIKHGISFWFQMFFIDHTAKTTSFIDPRMPNELPLLPADLAPPTLLMPNDPNATLLPPPPPRNHGASLTPPPSGSGRGFATSPNGGAGGSSFLAPPSDTSGRRRSRSVGDDDIARHSGDIARHNRQSSSNISSAVFTATGTCPPADVITYNDRVVAFMRQPNVVDVLKEKTNRWVIFINDYKGCSQMT